MANPLTLLKCPLNTHMMAIAIPNSQPATGNAEKIYLKMPMMDITMSISHKTVSNLAEKR